jgi:hypothetical protein
LDERLGENEFVALAFIRHELTNRVRMFNGDDVSKRESAKSYRLGGLEEE